MQIDKTGTTEIKVTRLEEIDYQFSKIFKDVPRKHGVTSITTFLIDVA